MLLVAADLLLHSRGHTGEFCAAANVQVSRDTGSTLISVEQCARVYKNLEL